MNYYLEVLQKYIEFNGRARRAEFWWFELINFIIVLVLMAIDQLLGMRAEGSLGVLSGLYSLAVFLPHLGVGVRRLHDCGTTGWVIVVGLIPLLGTGLLVFLWIREGTPGDNEYGSNPKESAAGAPA